MDSKMKTVGVIALVAVAAGLLFVSLKGTVFESGPAKATPEQGRAMAESMRKAAEERQKSAPPGVPANINTGGAAGQEAPK